MRFPAYQAFVSRKISYHEDMIRTSPLLHAEREEQFSVTSILVCFQNQAIQGCAGTQILQLKEKKLKQADTITKGNKAES